MQAALQLLALSKSPAVAVKACAKLAEYCAAAAAAAAHPTSSALLTADRVRGLHRVAGMLLKSGSGGKLSAVRSSASNSGGSSRTHDTAKAEAAASLLRVVQAEAAKRAVGTSAASGLGAAQPQAHALAAAVADFERWLVPQLASAAAAVAAAAAGTAAAALAADNTATEEEAAAGHGCRVSTAPAFVGNAGGSAAVAAAAAAAAAWLSQSGSDASGGPAADVNEPSEAVACPQPEAAASPVHRDGDGKQSAPCSSDVKDATADALPAATADQSKKRRLSQPLNNATLSSKRASVSGERSGCATAAAATEEQPSRRSICLSMNSSEGDEHLGSKGSPEPLPAHPKSSGKSFTAAPSDNELLQLQTPCSCADAASPGNFPQQALPASPPLAAQPAETPQAPCGGGATEPVHKKFEAPVSTPRPPFAAASCTAAAAAGSPPAVISPSGYTAEDVALLEIED